MKKFLISCLEPSANLHFYEVLKELGNCEIVGIFDAKFGKPYMESREFSAMGFVEVLPLIFKAKRAIKEMVNLAKDCDAVLFIDSPAFNLPLAKAIKNAGIKIPITYYILPQVWAWKPHRVAQVERYCDNLASILPFDLQFYTRAMYVGHPILDEIKFSKLDQNIGQISNSSAKTIAFLPGSRKSEIKRLMPIFRELAKKFSGARKILPIPLHLMNELSGVYGDLNEFELTNDAPKALYESDFAFICSGTATLEAALIGTPFVLAYKAKAIDILIAKFFVKLKYIGLANIMFEFMQKEPLNAEFLQNEVTTENLYNAYLNCDTAKFQKACLELKKYLKYGSAKNVAEILLK